MILEFPQVGATHKTHQRTRKCLSDFLKDDASVSIKESVEDAISLIHHEYPDLGGQLQFVVNDCASTFPRKLMVVFFYNLVRKQVQHRHEHAQIRLFVRESAGKIKGMIKEDTLPNSPFRQPSVNGSAQTGTAFLNRQNLDEEGLVNMLTKAGYQSSITRYNDFTLSYEIDLKSFIDLNAKRENVANLQVKKNAEILAAG